MSSFWCVFIQSEKEESYASKKSSSFRFEIISPHSCPGASSDDKNLRFLYDESRSPRYTQKYSRNAGLTKSPIKIEVVDDRFRDKEHRNRRLSNIESKLKQISIDDQKNVDKSQLPVARPSGEILREKASSLQVCEPPQAQIIQLPLSNSSGQFVFSSTFILFRDTSLVISFSGLKVQMCYILCQACSHSHNPYF